MMADRLRGFDVRQTLVIVESLLRLKIFELSIETEIFEIHKDQDHSFSM